MVEVLIKAGASLDVQDNVGCLLNYSKHCSALEIHGLSCVTFTCLLHSSDTTLRLCEEFRHCVWLAFGRSHTSRLSHDVYVYPQFVPLVARAITSSMWCRLDSMP